MEETEKCRQSQIVSERIIDDNYGICEKKTDKETENGDRGRQRDRKRNRREFDVHHEIVDAPYIANICSPVGYLSLFIQKQLYTFTFERMD